eukprot:5190645-Pyramimonas_sp.AAC.1
MKPHRLCMTHALVLAYKLHEKLEVYKPRRVYPVEMATFHSEDYIDFLNRITPENQHEYMEQLQRFNLAEDCPIFDNLFEFCRIYTGGSMDGAVSKSGFWNSSHISARCKGSAEVQNFFKLLAQSLNVESRADGALSALCNRCG